MDRLKKKKKPPSSFLNTLLLLFQNGNFDKLGEVNGEVDWICIGLVVNSKSRVPGKHRISSIKRKKFIWTFNL